MKIVTTCARSEDEIEAPPGNKGSSRIQGVPLKENPKGPSKNEQARGLGKGRKRMGNGLRGDSGLGALGAKVLGRRAADDGLHDRPIGRRLVEVGLAKDQ